MVVATGIFYMVIMSFISLLLTLHLPLNHFGYFPTKCVWHCLGLLAEQFCAATGAESLCCWGYVYPFRSIALMTCKVNGECFQYPGGVTIQ